MTGNSANSANKRIIAMVVTTAVARISRGCITARNFSFVSLTWRRPGDCLRPLRPRHNALIRQCFENDSQADCLP
jgi:hypothetical protein